MCGPSKAENTYICDSLFGFMPVRCEWGENKAQGAICPVPKNK